MIKKLLLASQSPRRKALLQELGVAFTTVHADCAENYPADLPPREVAAYLSQKKSFCYTGLQEDELLLTADTVVICNNEILGKPKDTTEACAMLLRLGNRQHQVITAYTLRSTSGQITQSDTADIVFDEVTAAEAAYYVQQYAPLDKAGSYGVQDWWGLAKIISVRGSFYTVMGLPTQLLYRDLQKFGFCTLPLDNV